MTDSAARPSPGIAHARTSNYRPEIDGLRALAVVAVIINHINKDLLPSGYLGVDIFFVISGYVITASLSSRQSRNMLDFVTAFYERRIKRLVPALVVFVLITSLLICLFNPDPGVALSVGWQSLLGISNLHLYLSATDYFAQATELNPFTHTWSLGVEEQFYLLFPLLIWFSGFGQQKPNGARNLFFWVAALSAASLISFVVLYPANQPAAYFLMPPRFWEMAAGCLIFLAFQKRARIEQALEQVPPLLVVAAMLAVMLLPLSAAVPATIGVVALTALLIACLKQGTAGHQIFSLAKVVAVGKISYSLYLWHWGVLSISRWTIGIHWWSLPLQIAAMLLLAIASYQWIEIPFRSAKIGLSRQQVFALGTGALGGAAAVVAGVATPLHHRAYLGPSITNTAAQPKECHKPKHKYLAPNICIYNPNGRRRTIRIIGDSHAGAIKHGAKALFANTTTRVIVYASGGTPFPPVGHYRKSEKEKDISKLYYYYELEQDLLQPAGSSDVIIIAMRLPYHFGGTYHEYPASDFVFLDGKGRQVSQADYFSLWRQALERLARKLPDTKFVVMTPTPEWKDAALLECSEQKPWLSRRSGKTCKLPRSFFVGRNGLYTPINRGLADLASRNNNIFVFDAFDQVCSQADCYYGDRGQPLYKDDDHISPMASRRIMQAMARQYPWIMTTNTP